MATDKEKVEKQKNPVRQELSRFKEVQETTLPQVQKLVEQYHKSNERLTAAGQRLALELKRLGEKDTNPWAKQLVQMAEQLNEVETLRQKEFEKPVHDQYLAASVQNLNADRENFKANRKRVKAALKKVDVRLEKLEKSGKTKESPEWKELEAKRGELLTYVRQFETMRLCKWMQSYCVVLNAQLNYHKAALAHLTAAQQAAVVHEPPALPVDTWTAYLDERERTLEVATKATPPPKPAAGTLKQNTATTAALAASAGGSSPSAPIAVTSVTTSTTSTAAPSAPAPAHSHPHAPAPAHAHSHAPSAPSGAPLAPEPGAPPKQVLSHAPKPKPGSTWQLFATDTGDDYYYFNANTGESIWELPADQIARE